MNYPYLNYPWMMWSPDHMVHLQRSPRSSLWRWHRVHCGDWAFHTLLRDVLHCPSIWSVDQLMMIITSIWLWLIVQHENDGWWFMRIVIVIVMLMMMIILIIDDQNHNNPVDYDDDYWWYDNWPVDDDYDYIGQWWWWWWRRWWWWWLLIIGDDYIENIDYIDDYWWVSYMILYDQLMIDYWWWLLIDQLATMIFLITIMI